MKRFTVILIYLFAWTFAFGQQNERIVRGTILEQNSQSPLPGVNVVMKGTNIGTVSNDEGAFSLTLPEGVKSILVFSYIGYRSIELELLPSQTVLSVYLEPMEMGLQEVTIVSTGFQELPLSRSTGSMVGIGQELVDRRISTNVIERIEDITPGLIFNRDISNAQPGESISIRGTATLISSSEPLIVVDNLAYDGPLSSINPNDVESITVLKDAAAASIWGARAGNGVIVITTKKGSFEKPLELSFTANHTLIQKPDPLYNPTMSINSLVDKQLDLYESGFFSSQIRNSRNPVVPPLAEAMYAFDQGLISREQLDNTILSFRNADMRKDIDRYLTRPASNQQYAVNARGGSRYHHYQLSLGWDQNLSSEVESDYSRLTLSSQQTWKVWKEKLQVNVGTYWVNSQSYNGMPSLSGAFPYERLADEQGNPLEVSRDYNVRFKDAMKEKLPLSWAFIPLEELNRSTNTSQNQELRVFTSLGYQITEGLDWSVNYQYWTNNSNNERYDSPQSYAARHLVNSFSQFSPDGELTLPVPLGGILDQRNQRAFSHNLRSQLNYQKTWKSHRLHVFGGAEIKDFQSESFGITSYGYNEINGTSLPVDYVTRFLNQGSNRLANIPFTEEFTGRTNRFVSAFGNLGYSYKDKFLLNASLRKDASNLFGVNINQKGVPLWSAGIGWILTEEKFLAKDWLDFAKLRLSYGFNGNTNPNVTAVTTANSFVGAQNLITRLPFLAIRTLPNPELRWERIKIVNAGLDFELLKSRISGSLEYYDKQGLDLLGTIPVYLSSGFNSATLNYASTRTKGWDLVINSRNTQGRLKWETSFFHSIVRDEVIDIENNPTATQLLNYSPALPTPAKGYPLFSVFSFDFAGLDPTDGSPMGFVNGEPSTNYGTIYSEATPENIRFHGSGRPTDFGSIRNTFSFMGFSLSANITYRLGYYFYRPTVNFDEVNRGNFGHADYELRWRQPGDELITKVPSDPGRVDAFKTGFYQSSAANVERGDHIRLQDIRLAYSWKGSSDTRSPFSNLETYLYVNNLGVLWKASDRVRDPDFLISPNLRSISLGLRASF